MLRLSFKEVIQLNVIFYHSNSDKRKVDKSLTTIITLPCDILDDNSILHPQLKIKYNASLLTANYIYIPGFNRYYFITNTTTSRGYLYIDTSVDVLMSFKSNIRNTTAVIDRQENVYNKYLNDPLYEGYSYEILSAYKLGNIFTKTSQPYLTVLGGD